MPANDTWTPPEVSAIGQAPDTGTQTAWQPPEVAEAKPAWTPPEVANISQSPTAGTAEMHNPGDPEWETAPAQDNRSLWQKANEPAINLPKFEVKGEQYNKPTGLPVLNADGNFLKSPHEGEEPDNLLISAAKSAWNQISGLADSLTSAPVLATMGAGSTPKIVQRAISGAWTVDMAKNVIENAPAVLEKLKDPNLSDQEKLDAMGGELAMGLFATGAAKHSLTGRVGPIGTEKPAKASISADAVRYEQVNREVQALMDKAKADNVPFTDSPEYAALAKEREEIKGRNNGMPPGKVAASPLSPPWEPPEVRAARETTPAAEPPLATEPSPAAENTPTANVTVMGSHTQVEIPGAGDRPAFSGTPEQARDAGFDVPTEGLADGAHKVPIEPAPSPEVIGIRNKMIDARREELGLDPLPKPETKADEQLWGKAVSDSLKDPELPARTVDELRSGSRVPTDQDYALLEYRAVELENANKAATDRINQAIDEGRSPDPVERLRMEETEAQLIDLHEVLRKTGTESGRGLRARQLLANRDFSLAKMVAERQALSGEKLTPEKVAETRDIAERVKTTQSALEKVTAERDALLAEKTSKAAHEELVKKVAEETDAPEAEKPAKARTPSKLREYIKSQAEAARQRVRERTGEMHAGIDPTHLTDLAIIGVEHLARAGENLAAFTKRMVEDVGEWVKPHIEQIFGEAKKMRDSMAKDFTPKEVVDAIGKKLSTGGDVTPEFRKLAREAIELGITDRDRVIDFVHDQIRETAPEMDRRAVQDAISGYGKFRELSKDEITQKLADVSAQLRLVSKLEDLLAGKEPEKTGIERRAPSEEETLLRNKIAELEKKANEDIAVSAALTREKVAIESEISRKQKETATGDFAETPKKANRPLVPELEAAKQKLEAVTKEWNQAKRKAGTNSDASVDSAKESRIRSLDKEISDLQKKVDAKDTSSPKKAANRPQSEEIETRKQKLEALRKELADLRKAEEPTPLDREKARLEKQVSELQKKVDSGDLSTKEAPVNRPAADPELEILKQRRDQLNRKLTDMRRGAAPKADPNQTRLRAMKTRLENSTKEFQRRLDEGDFTAKKPRAPISDPAVDAAKAENIKVKQEYYEALAKDKFEKSGPVARTVETFLRWRRGFILSSPITIAKLQAAAIMRAGFTPAEELVGGALSQLPGVSEVAKRAPREGGYSKDAEIQALKGIALGYKTDFLKSLKTGHSELDTLYGKQHFDLQGKSIADYPGYAHAALKAPIKRMEFERSLEKRLGWARDNGIDVYDPAVLQQIKLDAYKDANRAIFMQDNILSDKINQFLSVKYNKETGEAIPGSVALHLVGKTLLPIVRVPTNIVAETFQFAVGLETGSLRLANAFRKGIETLQPEQADLIMRELKKGTLGTAVLLLGYFGAESIGGFYNPLNKKKPGDVKEGELRVFGEDIPKYLLHHPLMETLQLAASVNHDLHAPFKLTKSGNVSLAELSKEPKTVSGTVVNSLFDLVGEVPLAREASTAAKLLDVRTRSAAEKDILQGIVVPQALSWVARYTDKDAQGEPIKREATTTVEHIKEAVPGLRETLPVKK